MCELRSNRILSPTTVLLNQAKAEEDYGGEKDRGRLVVPTMRDDVNVSSSVVAGRRAVRDEMEEEEEVKSRGLAGLANLAHFFREKCTTSRRASQSLNKQSKFSSHY